MTARKKPSIFDTLEQDNRQLAAKKAREVQPIEKPENDLTSLQDNYAASLQNSEIVNQQSSNDAELQDNNVANPQDSNIAEQQDNKPAKRQSGKIVKSQDSKDANLQSNNLANLQNSKDEGKIEWVVQGFQIRKEYLRNLKRIVFEEDLKMYEALDKVLTEYFKKGK